MITATAPGRVELLGNHTDYNEGVVLAGAIDRGITIVGEKRGDGLAVLHSRTLGRTVEVSLSEVRPLTAEIWANYPLGVVHELLLAGHPIGGFSAEIGSTVPPGSGLSSSAALEVATACFLLKLHSLSMAPLELARLCQRAENHFVGVPSGLLDQATSVFGRAHQVVYLDCRSGEVRTIPFPPDLALIVADSGSEHRLVESAYRTRREECRAAVRQLGVSALRDLTPAELETAALEPSLRRRAAHVVGENERVWRAVRALAEGDGAVFGQLMNESHESSRTLFENSTPELDVLTGIARALPGVFGSRLTGGGFGGSIVSLVKSACGEEVAARLAEIYQARTGLQASPFICQLSDGAH